jgi:hypothetical protein
MVTNEGHKEGLEVSVVQSSGPFGGREGMIDEGGEMVQGREVVLDFMNCFTGIGHR